jgi:large repetitive protein
MLLFCAMTLSYQTHAPESIGGATGTAAPFKVGDTATAIWDNTANGDNNDDVSSVTVE